MGLFFLKFSIIFHLPIASGVNRVCTFIQQVHIPGTTDRYPGLRNTTVMNCNIINPKFTLAQDYQIHQKTKCMALPF